MSTAHAGAESLERVVVDTEALVWISSLVAGLRYRMLDHTRGELEPATSIVAYPPRATLPAHEHHVGEELLVLEGLFTDEFGHYAEGTYVRQPPGSKPTRRVGPKGARLFVKRGQLPNGDVQRVVVDTTAAAWRRGVVSGLSVLPLHEFGTEHVALVRWAPNTYFHRHAHWGGEEILVLDGVFRDEHGNYPAGSWLRNPHLSSHQPFTAGEGATIFVKVGHLFAPSGPPSVHAKGSSTQ